MTQAPAGWYPGNDGNERFWDGQQWTDQMRTPNPTQVFPSVPPPPTPYVAPARGPSANGTSKSGQAWYRKTWVIAVAVLLVGIGIGAASAGSTDPKTTPEYKSISSDLNDEKAARESAETDLAAAQDELASKLGDIPAREKVLEKGEATLKEKQANLVAKTKSVAKREARVGIVEKTIAANTIDGTGMYAVGKEIKAGTYKTGGSSGCYYAILTSTNTSDVGSIVNNNNTNGPAFVTVRNGQYFQTERCAKWVLQP